jgi:RNA polymerase sigma-70 factor (ECF subfamily)
MTWAAVTLDLFFGARGSDDASTPTRDGARSPHRDTPPGNVISLGMSDMALISHIRAGDEAAFDTLVCTYQPRLVHFAEAILGVDRAVAEDATQDILARLWIRRATWSPTVSVQAYLYQAVRNRILDLHKHDRVRMRYAFLENADPSADSAERAVLAAATVESMLAALRPRQRMALLLRYQHGLTFAEIAATMETTVKQAEGFVGRGIRALRILAERDR